MTKNYRPINKQVKCFCFVLNKVLNEFLHFLFERDSFFPNFQKRETVTLIIRKFFECDVKFFPKNVPKIRNVSFIFRKQIKIVKKIEEN